MFTIDLNKIISLSLFWVIWNVFRNYSLECATVLVILPWALAKHDKSRYEE